MSSTTTYRCDRCRDEMLEEDMKAINVGNPHLTGYRQLGEICQSCMESLEEWMKGGKPEKDDLSEHMYGN